MHSTDQTDGAPRTSGACNDLMWTGSQLLPSKHAGSNPEACWLRPVMTITASVQPVSARVVYAGSDFPHLFQFRFSKEGKDHIVQNRPGSDLDDLVRVWLNTSGLEASRCTGITGPGFWQDATGPLPVSHFWTWLYSSTDILDNIVQNQPGSDLVLADCVRFWPNGSGPEASRCARIIRPVSGRMQPVHYQFPTFGPGCILPQTSRIIFCKTSPNPI